MNRDKDKGEDDGRALRVLVLVLTSIGLLPARPGMMTAVSGAGRSRISKEKRPHEQLPRPWMNAGSGVASPGDADAEVDAGRGGGLQAQRKARIYGAEKQRDSVSADECSSVRARASVLDAQMRENCARLFRVVDFKLRAFDISLQVDFDLDLDSPMHHIGEREGAAERVRLG